MQWSSNAVKQRWKEKNCLTKDERHGNTFKKVELGENKRVSRRFAEICGETGMKSLWIKAKMIEDGEQLSENGEDS